MKKNFCIEFFCQSKLFKSYKEPVYGLDVLRWYIPYPCKDQFVKTRLDLMFDLFGDKGDRAEEDKLIYQ